MSVAGRLNNTRLELARNGMRKMKPLVYTKIWYGGMDDVAPENKSILAATTDCDFVP